MRVALLSFGMPLWLFAATSLLADDSLALKYYRQGESLFHKKDFDQALPWYQKSLEQRATDGPVVVEERTLISTLQYGRFVQSVTKDDTLREDYFPNRRIEEIKELKRRENPPKLNLKWITLREPTHDNVLDGGENGDIVVNIENNGSSVAREVKLSVKVQQPGGLAFVDSIPVGEIEPGTSVVHNIQVHAEKNIAEITRNFAIIAREFGGFDSPPLEVIFRTRPTGPVRVEIANIVATDFSNDDVIKPMEPVTVSMRILNSGDGVADGAVVRVVLGEHVYLSADSARTVPLGNLYRNEFKDVSFTFHTDKRLQNGARIPVGIEVEGHDGRVLARNDLALVIHVDPTTVVTVDPTVPADILKNPVDVDIAIPEGPKKREHAVAVIIGNQDYARAGLPQVEFALRDAKVMKEYLKKTFGYSEANILYIENATASAFAQMFGNRENFAGKLYNYVTPEVSDVFIYYSGHGAPDLKSKGAYFVPVDADPSLIALSGYSLDTFYRNIARLPARSVTVVLDTCFSGNNLGASVERSNVSIEYGVAQLDARATVFTSAGDGQVSSWYKEKRHSLFTYFFLYGLSGAADQSEDGEITTTEMHNYLQKNVVQQARKNGQEQTPQLVQKEEKVLLKYRNGGSVARR